MSAPALFVAMMMPCYYDGIGGVWPVCVGRRVASAYVTDERENADYL